VDVLLSRSEGMLMSQQAPSGFSHCWITPGVVLACVKLLKKIRNIGKLIM
jgi:hypothetical protein